MGIEVFTINSQSILTVLSGNELGTIIRRGSAWAGVHAGTAAGQCTCEPSHVSKPVQKACGRSMLLLVTRMVTAPRPLSQLPLTASVFLLASGFCLVL